MNFVDSDDQLVSIAQIVRRCPTITLRRAFTRAYRDWAGQTQYLRVAITGATVGGQALYSLGSDPYVEITAILAIQGSFLNGSSTQYWPMAPSDSSMWNPAVNNDQPLRYCYVPQAQFALNPTPDAVYDLTVTAIVQPKENAAQVPETGLTKYRSGIEAGALGYLLSLPGQVWTNPVEAERNRRAFQASINNARADVQRAFNTGSVRTRRRAFVV
jgi:hypothetical protein